MSSLEAVPTATLRPDTWSANNAHSSVRYRIQADAQPALLCQVLNLFAMQYLVPLQVNVVRQADWLHIEVDVDGLSRHRAEVIGEKMRNLVDVASVALSPVESDAPVHALHLAQVQACG